jgi:MFS family permease
VCLTALGIAAVSFAAPAITVVGLKSIAADLGGERSVPALAYSLAWLGASFGGIAMGHAAERFGVRGTVSFGSLMIAVGLVLAQSGSALGLLLGYGVFIGLLGNAAMNAPLYTYVSRWFDRRRGTALALLGSGSSVSAAVWAPIFAVSEAQFGWRNTMLCFAAIEVALIIPAALLMLGPAPEQPGAAGLRPAGNRRRRCLGCVRGPRWRCWRLRVSAAVCRWRCRRAILSHSAAMPAFRRR